jgi:hypothetical protein
MPRQKYLRFYGDLELRVEQIQPHLWGVLVYDPRIQYSDAFGARDEETAKEAAIATAFNASLPFQPPDTNWRNCSVDPDEQWDEKLKELGFRGYRYGLDIFDSQGRILPRDPGAAQSRRCLRKDRP